MIEDLLDRCIAATGTIGRNRARIGHRAEELTEGQLEAFERLVEYIEANAEAMKGFSRDLES